jgi:hypothetical protein
MQVKGSGPWWQNIQALSDTHALGWAEQALIATTDGTICVGLLDSCLAHSTDRW